jgi:hypothetical protein
MASAGFSAPINYFEGWIPANLSPVASNENKSCSVAEAANEYGDVIEKESFGSVWAPSVDYILTGTVNLGQSTQAAAGTTPRYTALALGVIVTYGSGSSVKYFMITGVTITTQAGQPPRVTVSGVEVEASATTKRYYKLSGTISPRSKAQDILSALVAKTANNADAADHFTQITTTFTIDPHVVTKAGTPRASDASHPRVEVTATLTDPANDITITAATNFTLSAPDSATNPDADYRTHNVTATRFFVGTEYSATAFP